MAGHLRLKLTRREARTLGDVLTDINILNIIAKRFSLSASDICNRAGMKMGKQIRSAGRQGGSREFDS